MIVHPAVAMGREQVPLWIVDDAHDAGEALRDAARDARFARSDVDRYPGVRAAAPDGYAAWLAALAGRVGVARQPAVVRAEYAIATDTPADLAPIQRIPHYDTLDPAVIAAVHYLCAPPHRGTGFYRHRRSGFERIDARRERAWRQGLVYDASAFGMPSAACEPADSALFVLTALAELRFNRVIFYPANCLHSGLIGTTGDAVPAHARMTITALLESRASRLPL